MNETYDAQSYAPRYSPENSVHQDDARIFHRAGYAYAVVVAVTDVVADECGVSFALALSDGEAAWLRVLVTAPHILRVLFARKPFDPPGRDQTSMLVDGPAFSTAAFTLESRDGVTRLNFGSYALEVTLDPFGLRIVDGNGKLKLELETERLAGSFITPPLGLRTPRGRTPEPFMSWRMHGDEHFWGLGEKWTKVERSSTRATIWNTDTCGSNTCDLSYKAVPVLYSTFGWGILVHAGHRSYWEVGTFSYTSASFLTEAPALDLFVFLGPNLKRLVEIYTSLTGRTERPPRWALGIWMSRCAYRNRSEVEQVLARLREERIPCDVVHLDPPWMKTHYYFAIGVDACDFEWNETAWPDRRDMLAGWRKRGFCTCFWINPYLPESHAIYREALDQGFLVKSTQGGIARLAYGEPVGMVDFTNPRAKSWYKSKLRGLIEDGAAVLKPDYGDRIPEDAVFFDGRTGQQMHNLYLHLYAETAWEAVREYTGQAIVWRRPGYIGTHRYAGTWAGDTQVSWEAMRACLRGGLSAGFTAEAFWSHDIGGFVGPKPDPELYIRWSQWGLLSPFSRFHGTTPREPWEYGATALDVVRHYAALRYRLIPYLEMLADEACATGLPILRHLALEYPEDRAAVHVDDQYLLGAALLVAPVFEAGARTRTLYVPEGLWTSWDDPSLRIEGPRFVTIPAPLERMPLLARCGVDIPVYTHTPEHLKGDLPRVTTVRL